VCVYVKKNQAEKKTSFSLSLVPNIEETTKGQERTKEEGQKKEDDSI